MAFKFRRAMKKVVPIDPLLDDERPSTNSDEKILMFMGAAAILAGIVWFVG